MRKGRKAVVVPSHAFGDYGVGAAGRAPYLPPTPLLSVANRPLLEHALDWLAAGGVGAAAVVVPEGMADELSKAVTPPARPFALYWVERRHGEPPSETFTAVAGFLEGEPFVLHSADNLAGQELHAFTRRDLPAGRDAVLLVDEHAERPGDDLADRRVRRLGSRARICTGGAPVGVALMGDDAWEGAAALEPGRPFDFERLADKLLEVGGGVRTRRVRAWWRFQGGGQALLAGNRFALDRVRPSFEPASVVDSEIQGSVAIHPTARIEASTVRGPVVIGREAQLRDAFIGPYTSIGDGVRIDGAEVEHSVICAGACIAHLGRRIEASIVGSGATILSDFRLPRAVRVRVGEGANVSLA